MKLFNRTCKIILKVANKLSKEEEERSEFLLQQLTKVRAKEAEILKELRPLIYKIEKGR